jgi:5-histidylcysteine sulfoxide synthase/putative 4-mercaptohistidine N1-methyltranferase
MHPFYTIPVALIGEDVAQKRQEVRDYFHNTFDLFEKLFEPLVNDTVFYQQPEPTRHPIIFYFGHTAAFFINKMVVTGIIKERINPYYESMFAVGVDEMVWDDMDECHYTWPSVDEVRVYRKEIRDVVDGLIMTLPLTLPIKEEDPFWVLLMGIEHERIHIETSSVLHRQLPLECVRPHELFPVCNVVDNASDSSMIPIKGKVISLGKERGHHLYGWDNEYGKQTVEVDDFLVSNMLVSNEDFMAFVKEGGYTNRSYWDEEGLAFLDAHKVTHPPFWVKKEDRFVLRLMLEGIEMPQNWPVEITYLEAKAYCVYLCEKEGKSYRLMSEAEWMLLYERAKIEDFPISKRLGNSALSKFVSPCPVNMFAFDDIYDLRGNVWQWSETHMDAYEGFEVHFAYDDFSTPTFDTKHNLIKGGSFISTGNALMKHSRYAFRRHFYQHAGFRVVEGDALRVVDESNIYETDMLVNQYCDFQYGASYFGVENFAVACAKLALKYTKNYGHALDLGCATGRATFELARGFDKVTGIDFSARFVQEGVSLQQSGQLSYYRAQEGDLVSHHIHTAQELDLESLRKKVVFWQGDACNLKAHFREYDLIIATNLIDRLYDPMLFLEGIEDRLNDEGMLILTSPYTWLVEYTPKEKWLGGYKDENGEEVDTLTTLKKILAKKFKFVEALDVPFVIRETPRKFQHTLSQMSVWKKR